MFNALSQLRTASAPRSVAAARVNDFALRSAFILGIGLATGAPDTQTAPIKRVAYQRILNPRSASRPGVLFFQPQIFQQHTRHFEDSRHELRHLLPLRQL
jgi:hypothetical protein